jgi:hypothetical protein
LPTIDMPPYGSAAVDASAKKADDSVVNARELESLAPNDHAKIHSAAR